MSATSSREDFIKNKKNSIDPYGRQPLVGIFAPASPVPQVEMAMNLEFLASRGVEIVVHEQCSKSHAFFAGTDEERAGAFLDLAYSKGVDILYGARGGYGSARLFPFIEKAAKKRGKPPKKILIGYSDMTALNAFVQARWGWKCIHSPMPSLNRLENLSVGPKNKLISVLRGEETSPKLKAQLELVSGKLVRPLSGPVKGGNLAVLCSLLGTPYFENYAKNTILFLEDVTETLYRIDRMMVQLAQSKMLKNVQAVVWGTFTQCEDKSPQVLADPVSGKTQPLRTVMTQRKAMDFIASDFTASTGIPVLRGLNVGHGMEEGKGQELLVFGEKYKLSKTGLFESFTD